MTLFTPMTANQLGLIPLCLAQTPGAEFGSEFFQFSLSVNNLDTALSASTSRGAGAVVWGRQAFKEMA